MRSVLPKRVRFSAEADQALRTVKARTGITPNLLCRMALMLAIENPERALSQLPDERLSDREIGAEVLFGDYRRFFEGAVRQRIPDAEADMVGPLIESGLRDLAVQLKSVADLGRLVRLRRAG